MASLGYRAGGRTSSSCRGRRRRRERLRSHSRPRARHGAAASATDDDAGGLPQPLGAAWILRFQKAVDEIAVGQISGAVGTFSFVDPSVEEHVCKKLGLKPAPVSSQIIQRDRHAEFFTTLAIIASSLDKFAQEIRLLQRTEVREAEEYFSPGQKGSSAMPHKRNPVLTENLTGLAGYREGVSCLACHSIRRAALYRWHR